MFSLELIAMNVEGVLSYFSQGWNYWDCIIVPVYGVFFALRYQSHDVQDTVSEHSKGLILLNAFILVYIMIKLVYFMKVNKTLGMMSALLLGVFIAVVPFLFVFMFFIFFFAMMSFTLGANRSLADGYTDMNPLIGYIVQTFENGIGNISAPTINFLSNGSKPESVLDFSIVYTIYLFWFTAQIILLVILLNFVIALISQHYENVMNSKVMHEFVMKQELNKEYSLFSHFFVKMGWRQD